MSDAPTPASTQSPATGPAQAPSRRPRLVITPARALRAVAVLAAFASCVWLGGPPPSLPPPVCGGAPPPFLPPPRPVPGGAPPSRPGADRPPGYPRPFLTSAGTTGAP